MHEYLTKRLNSTVFKVKRIYMYLYINIYIKILTKLLAVGKPHSGAFSVVQRLHIKLCHTAIKRFLALKLAQPIGIKAFKLIARSYKTVFLFWSKACSANWHKSSQLQMDKLCESFHSCYGKKTELPAFNLIIFYCIYI